MIKRARCKVRLELPGYPPQEFETDCILISAPTKEELDTKLQATVNVIKEMLPEGVPTKH